MHETARFTFKFVKFLNPNLFSLLETFITSIRAWMMDIKNIEISLAVFDYSIF